MVVISEYGEEQFDSISVRRNELDDFDEGIRCSRIRKTTTEQMENNHHKLAYLSGALFMFKSNTA
jgi:hypothetical protein